MYKNEADSPENRLFHRINLLFSCTHPHCAHGSCLCQRNGQQIQRKWRWMGLHVQSSRQAVPDKWVFTRTLDLSRSQPKKQSHTLHVCEY